MMAKTSAIEWTQATWNPWHGCIKVSPGCAKCYMYRDKERYGQDPRQVARSKTTFTAPQKWKEPKLIFTCSWSDWFIEEADAWRDDAWDVIRKTPQHTYQILTKRPERIGDCLPRDWGWNGWDNVWLGVSVETQDYLDRVQMLKQIPAGLRFISAEPLLGSIDFGDLSGIGWVITGGESDPANPRPMKPEWAISIRDQCKTFGIPFFHKQNGGSVRVDGVWGGAELDGKVYREFPLHGEAKRLLQEGLQE